MTTPKIDSGANAMTDLMIVFPSPARARAEAESDFPFSDFGASGDFGRVRAELRDAILEGKDARARELFFKLLEEGIDEMAYDSEISLEEARSDFANYLAENDPGFVAQKPRRQPPKPLVLSVNAIPHAFGGLVRVPEGSYWARCYAAGRGSANY